jgi:ribosomal protein S12 methylthiotransferase
MANTKHFHRKPKIGMISLGCAKNLVDAEIMLGSVLQRGMEITSRAEDADVLVINTCAFIDSAKEESIEAILEAHQQRGLNKRPDQKLIVSGCMSQRFAKDLQNELPEVDAFIDSNQVSELGTIVEKLVTRRSPVARSTDATEGACAAFHRHTPHVHSRLRHPAFQTYSRAFCLREDCGGLQSSVQLLRDSTNAGKHRSRKPESILAEIRALVAEGVRENQLDQSGHHRTTEWICGTAEPGRGSRWIRLADRRWFRCLHEIQQIEGEFWVRLLYTHPAHWSDELIDTIAQCDKVARYIDIPLQHIDESMLVRMRRETSRSHIEELIHKLRAGIPGVTLRTTFIVGFPARPMRNSRRYWILSAAAGSNGLGYSNTRRKRVRAPRGCRAGRRKNKKFTLSSGDGDAAIHCP